jgi:hypothetical protein
MSGRVTKSRSRVLALAIAAMLPVTLAAQDSVNKNAAQSSWDIFAGYSFLAPHGTINTPLPNGNGGLSPVPVVYSSITPGGIVSLVRYFNEHVGLEFSGDIHMEDESAPNGVWRISKDDLSGAEAGLVVRKLTSDVTPFFHVMGGMERVGGPHWQLDTWGPAVTAGAGLDYATHLFGGRLALRLLQGDYQFVHEDYGNVIQGGSANINALRLSAGFVFHASTVEPPQPPTMV